MKANELRIGNWAFVNGEEREVSMAVLTNQYMTDQIVPPLPVPLCEPIPITAEWLERFGFEKINRYNYFLRNLIVNPEYGHSFIFDLEEWVDDPLDDDAASICGPQVEYVHQLQNLYFALTGEELTNNK